VKGRKVFVDLQKSLQRQSRSGGTLPFPCGFALLRTKLRCSAVVFQSSPVEPQACSFSQAPPTGAPHSGQTPLRVNASSSIHSGPGFRGWRTTFHGSSPLSSSDPPHERPPPFFRKIDYRWPCWTCNSRNRRCFRQHHQRIASLCSSIFDALPTRDLCWIRPTFSTDDVEPPLRFPRSTHFSVGAASTRLQNCP